MSNWNPRGIKIRTELLGHIELGHIERDIIGEPSRSTLPLSSPALSMAFDSIRRGSCKSLSSVVSCACSLPQSCSPWRGASPTPPAAAAVGTQRVAWRLLRLRVASFPPGEHSQYAEHSTIHGHRSRDQQPGCDVDGGGRSHRKQRSLQRYRQPTRHHSHHRLIRWRIRRPLDRCQSARVVWL